MKALTLLCCATTLLTAPLEIVNDSIYTLFIADHTAKAITIQTGERGIISGSPTLYIYTQQPHSSDYTLAYSLHDQQPDESHITILYNDILSCNVEHMYPQRFTVINIQHATKQKPIPAKPSHHEQQMQQQIDNFRATKSNHDSQSPQPEPSEQMLTSVMEKLRFVQDAQRQSHRMTANVKHDQATPAEHTVVGHRPHATAHKTESKRPSRKERMLQRIAQQKRSKRS